MKKLSFYDARQLDSREIRKYIRKDIYTNHTSGLAVNKLQANVVILPKTHANEFHDFCLKNSKSCPLVGKTDVGDPIFKNLGDDIDIRYDVPSYNIYKNGELNASVKNIQDYWRKDLVSFAIGCSFTFEHELLKHNLSIDHVDNNKIVPMYKTNIKNISSGVFNSNMVVSMRIFKKSDEKKIIDISKQFLFAHGEPIHIGEEKKIGIEKILRPDWGDPPRLKKNDESYYFWACGVTPQNALMQAKIPFCITHTPGHMLITDKFEKDISNLEVF